MKFLFYIACLEYVAFGNVVSQIALSPFAGWHIASTFSIIGFGGVMEVKDCADGVAGNYAKRLAVWLVKPPATAATTN